MFYQSLAVVTRNVKGSDNFDVTRIRIELPIGSGEIESAHRYVVQARLKCLGAWWVANNMGTSLNQLIRDHLELLTQKGQSSGDLEEFISLSGKGHSVGWKFNRDELHERTWFYRYKYNHIHG